MSTIIKELVYKDFDFTFKAHPATGTLNVKKNAEAIKQAVKLLILTNFYERPYRPTLGSGVYGSLFENITPITMATLRRSIEDAIRSFEPRAELLDVDVSAKPDLNSLDITIVFIPVNGRAAVQTTITLERSR